MTATFAGAETMSFSALFLLLQMCEVWEGILRDDESPLPQLTFSVLDFIWIHLHVCTYPESICTSSSVHSFAKFRILLRMGNDFEL
jgi:hypothetical protein